MPHGIGHEVAEDSATCRPQADAPEIGGNLFIDEGRPPGDIVPLRAEAAGEYGPRGAGMNRRA